MTAEGWTALGRAAREQDLLDAVDLALIQSLARRAGRSDDMALQAVLGCLLATVRTGALRIPLAEEALTQRLEAFFRALHAGPDIPLPDAAGLAASFTAARLQGAYAAVLGSPPDFLPLLHSAGGLYFQKHQAAEALAGTRLRHFLTAPAPAVSEAAQAEALDAVLRRFPLRAPGGGRLPLEFRGGQKEALALALRSRFLVVSGGPGTGKTSLVANLLRAWLRADAGRTPGRVRLAAPTGRAARRMSESLRRGLEGIVYHDGAATEAAGAEAAGVETALDQSLAAVACETLHRLLRYNPATGEYFHQRGRRLPADLVVVDEVSMVDIFTLARLLDALEDGASLVLLGDMDQLPSVDSGAVLADLVSGGQPGASPLRGHLVLLENSHRSEASILDVTRRINALDAEGALAAMPPPLSPGRVEPGVPAAPRLPWPTVVVENGRKVSRGGGCRMLTAPEAGFAAGRNAWLDSWLEFHYREYGEWVEKLNGLAAQGQSAVPEREDWQEGLGALFAGLDRARILTLTRKGWYGSVAVNRHCRDRLLRRWHRGAPPSGEAFNGAPILILENDPDKDLHNGEVGVLLRLRGRETAFFQRGGGYLSFPAQFLPRHELAFAMTVHKSQGSEYDQVLLILPEAGNRLLFKETLYTALTRARHFAGIYGSPEVFREAVGKKVIRESGLAGYLETVAIFPVGMV